MKRVLLTKGSGSFVKKSVDAEYIVFRVFAITIRNYFKVFLFFFVIKHIG